VSIHLHMIAAAPGEASLLDILRDFKKFTSKAIIIAVEEAPETSHENFFSYSWIIIGEFHQTTRMNY